MKFVCKLVVVSAKRTTVVFDLHRVVGVVVDRYMMEDRFDRFSS